MKIIELLNKIANGEEVPKKIKVNNMFVYEYDKDIDYKSKDGFLELNEWQTRELNELLEEIE